MVEQGGINPAYVEECRRHGYRWKEIAEGLLVTDRVLERWRERTHFVDPIIAIPNTEEGNNFLDTLVRSYLQDTGRRGEVFTRFYIQTLGYHVPRERLRDSIWRVDPYGRFNRRPARRIPRVVYDVEGPMHLVHIDGTWTSISSCFSHTYTHNLSLSFSLSLSLYTLIHLLI